MKLGWAALTTVLALSALMPGAAAAQQSSPPTPPPREQKGGFGLGQNYPTPFNPETRIPFTVGDVPTCSDPARQYRVTLRIYNLLALGLAVAMPIPPLIAVLAMVASSLSVVANSARLALAGEREPQARQQSQQVGALGTAP